MKIRQSCAFVLKTALELAETTNSSHITLIRRILNKRKRRRAALLIEHEAKRKIPKAATDFCKSIESMSDDVFCTHFQMNRSTFEKLQSMIKPLWPTKKVGRIGISLEKSLQITIWKLVKNCAFRDISELFGVAIGLAYKNFVKIIEILCRLKEDVIKFPTTEVAQKQISEAFSNLRIVNPFPSVIGCVDETHIPISQPVGDSNSYLNQKGTYSLIAQAIVDSRMKFIDVYIGCPGACRDKSIWHMSSIRKAIINKELNIGSNYHFLGNSNYPLETYIMVPYNDTGLLTPMQTNYNTILSSTRVVADQAFSVLRKKFGILKYVYVQQASMTKLITMACMVLHNIIIDHESNNADEMMKEAHSIVKLEVSEEITLSEQKEASAKRDALATLLSIE